MEKKKWLKDFKRCRYKLYYRKAGNGGTLTRCGVRCHYNFVGFNRCMHSKCPVISDNWEYIYNKFIKGGEWDKNGNR